MNRSVFWLCTTLSISASILGWLLPVTADADTRTDYLINCGGCHGVDGRGAPPDVPSLRGEPGRIVAVEGGRDYLYRVPGPSQAQLSDHALAEVMNFVLREFNRDTLDASFVPYTGEEISKRRSEVLLDPVTRREEIWGSYD